MSLPAYLQNSQAPRLAERTVQNLGAGAPPHLSIKGNRFTLVDSAGVEEPAGDLDKATGMFYFDCVLVDALERESKIYYEKPFDPSAQGFAPPDCWSDNGIGPSRNAGKPQAPLCGTCPKAEWGSAVSKVSGKGVPACAKNQKLALLPLGDDMLFLLRVPPNSLSNLRDYLNKFKGQDSDFKDVVTRVAFVKDQLGTLTFSATAYIDEQTYKTREALYAKKATDLLVGRGDLPREGLVAPQTVQQIEAQPNPTSPAPAAVTHTPPMMAAPSAAPVQQAEPTRRRGRKPAEAVSATNGAGTMAPFRPEPAPAAQTFGIQSGVAPDPELSATLDSIFEQPK